MLAVGEGVGESMASTSLIVGPTIPVADSDTGKVVELVKAGGSALQADRVFLGRDYANYVVSTGNSPSSSTAESLWWLSDSGVRFGVAREDETLRALGLSSPPRRLRGRCCGCWRRPDVVACRRTGAAQRVAGGR